MVTSVIGISGRTYKTASTHQGMYYILASPATVNTSISMPRHAGGGNVASPAVS